MTIEHRKVHGTRGTSVMVTYWRGDEAGAAYDRLIALATEEFGAGVPLDISGGTPNDKGLIDPAFLMAVRSNRR